MEFSIWDVLIDFSIISGLLLVGVLLRAKFVIIQKSFMPASIIAGLLGLILGPFALDVLPFSELIGTYPGMLIAFVFAALPFATGKFKVKEVINKVGGLWSYSQTIMILFYSLGLLFALVVLSPFFTDLHNGFGLLLAAGFVGGHGTAAAVGEAFALQGWEDATSIAMTSATVGALTAITVGLLLIKRAASKGQTNYIEDFKNLPNGLRTGLLPEDEWKSAGESKISSIVVDPLVYHLMFIVIATGIGYYLSVLGEQLLPDVAIPAFSLAFIVALLIRLATEATGADKYLDKEIFSKISGGATDYLVAFGIASINLTIVAQNLVPFILLMVFGILLAIVFYRFLSGYYFQENWFEKGIFTFGWITGAVAMAIALIRVADPKQESETLEDFGLAYVPIAPVEIALITFGPLFIAAGQHWLFIGISLVFVLMILFFSYSQGWVKKSRT
ncbi:sodium/glutamate symporter [Salinicoccus halitifaciens]|uniref:ESS family glutamate:Na+ symporter n=1 Tax=Salinicoccus halitifaciens TaxID=1073415 RepID=A0ABV2E949_9STAP|nr:sodium:glutamate symporter [Salinicoccus halitifaciens]MCD2137961.1 sodium:glutamate symporter [Salinicoccus halitifaciens]